MYENWYFQVDKPLIDLLTQSLHEARVEIQDLWRSQHHGHAVLPDGLLHQLDLEWMERCGMVDAVLEDFVPC